MNEAGCKLVSADHWPKPEVGHEGCAPAPSVPLIGSPVWPCLWPRPLWLQCPLLVVQGSVTHIHLDPPHIFVNLVCARNVSQRQKRKSDPQMKIQYKYKYKVKHIYFSNLKNIFINTRLFIQILDLFVCHIFIFIHFICIYFQISKIYLQIHVYSYKLRMYLYITFVFVFLHLLMYAYVFISWIYLYITFVFVFLCLLMYAYVLISYWYI